MQSLKTNFVVRGVIIGDEFSDTTLYIFQHYYMFY